MAISGQFGDAALEFLYRYQHCLGQMAALEFPRRADIQDERGHPGDKIGGLGSRHLPVVGRVEVHHLQHTFPVSEGHGKAAALFHLEVGGGRFIACQRLPDAEVGNAQNEGPAGCRQFKFDVVAAIDGPMERRIGLNNAQNPEPVNEPPGNRWFSGQKGWCRGHHHCQRYGCDDKPFYSIGVVHGSLPGFLYRFRQI